MWRELSRFSPCAVLCGLLLMACGGLSVPTLTIADNRTTGYATSKTASQSVTQTCGGALIGGRLSLVGAEGQWHRHGLGLQRHRPGRGWDDQHRTTPVSVLGL